MKLDFSVTNRKQTTPQTPQWIYQQDLYRFRQDSVFDSSFWQKCRSLTLQEAHWIILFGIIFMLVGGMFILLWSFIAFDALSV